MNHALSPGERLELVDTLKAILRFPTEDPPGGELALARHIEQSLKAWAIPAVVDEFAPGRANVLARIGDAGSAKRLIFSAHLDTMPVGSGEWTHGPFAAHEVGGRIYGRGAADMKGGVAAMIFALKRLAQHARELGGELVLALSAGESSSCLGAKRFVYTGALAGAQAILVSEPSSLNVLVAETGALWLKAHATGTPGHASGAGGSCGTGDNAILKIADCINALRNLDFAVEPHPLLGLPALRFGTVEGGSAINLTPDQAALGIDIRYLPGMRAEAIVKMLQTHAGHEIHFEVIDDKPPVEVPVEHEFVTTCSEACRETLANVPPAGGVAYFSDSNVLCPALGIPRVIIGPGELGMSGQRDEYVEIDKLAAAVEIYSRIAIKVLGSAV